jgi:hypothetical protein
MLFILVTFLSLLHVVSINAIDITANALMFFGMSFFYSSYIKHYQMGVFFSSVLFLAGTLLFVFAKFEIWNFGTVFGPSALIIIGSSLLITSFLTKTNLVLLLISGLSLFAGVWLLIMRGTSTVDLYLSALYNLILSYWFIFLFLAGIIFLTLRNVKNGSDGQN